MNPTNENPNTCPSPEELSAWFDGAGERDLREHLETCAACRQAVDAYRRIDAATRTAMQTSGDLAERIKGRCRALPARPPLWLTVWHQPLLRWAAALLVLGWFVVLAGHRLRPESKSDTAVADAGAGLPGTTPEPDLLVSDPTPSQAGVTQEQKDDAAQGSAAAPAAVRSADISRVAASGDQRTVHRVVMVPGRVRHVWVVKDLAAARTLLETNLPADVSHTVTASEDGTVSVQTLLPDRALQDLVDRLSGAGLSLVSPSVPQPGGGKNIVATGRLIRYDVDLVTRE